MDNKRIGGKEMSTCGHATNMILITLNKKVLKIILDDFVNDESPFDKDYMSDIFKYLIPIHDGLEAFNAINDLIVENLINEWLYDDYIDIDILRSVLLSRDKDRLNDLDSAYCLIYEDHVKNCGQILEKLNINENALYPRYISAMIHEYDVEDSFSNNSNPFTEYMNDISTYISQKGFTKEEFSITSQYMYINYDDNESY